MIQDVISGILLIVGAAFILLAGVGVVRMPDVFLRMSTSTKAGTLGLAFVMIGCAIHFANLGVTARALGILLFILLTAPISAHMIGRAAYFTGAQIWSETKIDELRGRYNLDTHTLESTPENAPNHTPEVGES